MQITTQKRSFNIIALSLTFLLSLFIFSCTKSNQLASAEERSVRAEGDGESEQGATVYNSQQGWLLDETVWIPCANNGNGEYAQLNGYVHFNYHTVVNDNHFTLVTHTNPNEVSGIGLTTGDKYVA